MIESDRLASGGVSIRCELQSRPDQVTDVLRAVRVILDRHYGTVPRDDTWELVVAEVLNNIVEHAYDDAGQGEIRVRLDFQPTCLRAAFTDFGRAMPDQVPPEGKPANVAVERQDLPEGGFGWFLIRSLTTTLSYRHADGANHLDMELPLARTA